MDMTLFFQTPSNKSGNTAQVVDGHLVLSLPAAKSPVVWRWNLAQAQAAALEVIESGTSFLLTMKTSDGATQNIAAFDAREAAVETLMMASQAMDKKGSSPIDNASESAKWLIAILGVLAVVGLFFYLARMTPQVAAPYVTDTAASDGQAGTANPEGAAGVPVSADDLLGGMQE
jgi:hypothetical protein